MPAGRPTAAGVSSNADSLSSSVNSRSRGRAWAGAAAAATTAATHRMRARGIVAVEAPSSPAAAQTGVRDNVTRVEPVVIAGGARTPIGRFNGALAKVDAVDLGAQAVKAALERTGLEPDYVAVGNVLQAANGQNPGRRAALQGGVGRTVPGITLNDVCLASMSAVGVAAAMIRGGEAQAVLVGGFDSMTRAPHALRTRPARRMGDAPMVDVMVHDGLYCSIADAGMGAMSDAENARLGISRAAQDAFAAASHQRAAAGAERLAQEIVAVGDLARDEGVRPGSTVDALAALKPAFTAEGMITAGNASQVSDGAAAAVVTTKDRAQKPLAEILGRAIVAGPDSTLHLRPAEASRKLLDRHGLKAS